MIGPIWSSGWRAAPFHVGKRIWTICHREELLGWGLHYRVNLHNFKTARLLSGGRLAQIMWACGAFVETTTKEPKTRAELVEILSLVQHDHWETPVVAIGGIRRNNAKAVIEDRRGLYRRVPPELGTGHPKARSQRKSVRLLSSLCSGLQPASKHGLRQTFGRRRHSSWRPTFETSQLQPTKPVTRREPSSSARRRQSRKSRSRDFVGQFLRKGKAGTCQSIRKPSVLHDGANRGHPGRADCARRDGSGGRPGQ